MFAIVLPLQELQCYVGYVLEIKNVHSHCNKLKRFHFECLFVSEQNSCKLACSNCSSIACNSKDVYYFNKNNMYVMSLVTSGHFFDG